MADPQFHCFCFKPLFRRSCYYAHQSDRSPVGQPLPFDFCWGASTDSWPHCDKLVLLVFIIIYIFSFSHSWCFFLFTEAFFPLTFAVHRIRRCFEPFGAGGAEAVPCCSSIGWYQRHKGCWKWHELAPEKNAVCKDLQNEEGVGDQCYWTLFCDWDHRYCDQGQPFRLPYLSKGHLCTDSKSPRKSAKLPGQQAFSTRPTFEVGDARLGSVGLRGVLQK